MNLSLTGEGQNAKMFSRLLLAVLHFPLVDKLPTRWDSLQSVTECFFTFGVAIRSTFDKSFCPVVYILDPVILDK